MKRVIATLNTNVTGLNKLKWFNFRVVVIHFFSWLCMSIIYTAEEWYFPYWKIHSTSLEQVLSTLTIIFVTKNKQAKTKYVPHIKNVFSLLLKRKNL